MMVTAQAGAGAASHDCPNWTSIDWARAERVVRRLQARIVQAAQAGKWGKVRALQHLLTHSFAAKALAVRRVTENHGKRTPGVDGEIWTTPEQKMAAIQGLRQRGYRPLPARRVYIPKRNGRRRPLSIITMRDRAMQTVYLCALDPLAEVRADRNSYGFRVGRSTADAIDQGFRVLCRAGSAAYLLEGDIQSCFTEIYHDWLLDHVVMDTAMLRRWLRAGYVELGRLFPTERGAAQGGPLSPVLANWTLDGLERLLARHCPSKWPHSPQVHVIRFADDFVVTGRDPSLLESTVKPLVEAFLQERGLTLSPEKTVVTPISDGVDFLGQHLRKYRGTLRITPSAKNTKAFLDKVRAIIAASRHLSAGELIDRLNPVIRGWALFHRHVSSSRVYARVDHAIFTALWAWARRRHPKKGAGWVRRQYFHTVGARHWVFSGTVLGPNRTPVTVRLYAATGCRFQRHTKVQAHANPYDPAWWAYFAQRRGRRTSVSVPVPAASASAPTASSGSSPQAASSR